MSSADVAAAHPAVGDAKPKTQAKKTGMKVKTGANKQPANHPKYSEMIHQALSQLKERGGSSRQAVLKYVMKNFKVGTDENIVNSHLKLALKAGVKSGALKQSKGSGASGSFRIGAEAKKPKTAKPKKAKATKSPKKPKAAKKATAGKKTAAPKKAKAEKAKKPAAAKKPKVEKVKKAASPVKKVKAASALKKTATKAKPKSTGVAKKPAAAKKA